MQDTGSGAGDADVSWQPAGRPAAGPRAGSWTATTAAYLAPANYVDSDHPLIIAKARQLCSGASAVSEAAQAVFYFARDLQYRGGGL